MSYPFELTFYVGHVLIEDQYIDNKVSIVAGNNEVWSSKISEKNLGIIRFKIQTDSANYRPELHIIEHKLFNWNNKTSLINLFKYLDTTKLPDDQYYCFYIKGEIPSNLFVESLNKRIGKTLLSKNSELQIPRDTQIYWVYIVSPENDSNIHTNVQIYKPSSNPLSHLRRAGLSLMTETKENGPKWSNNMDNTNNMGIPNMNNKNMNKKYTVKGQSLSTNCAQITVAFS